jgi:hypothetical protein
MAIVITGCATPGPPKPPSLNLPKPVSDLSAERRSDLVELHWTTPDKTTDGIDVKAPLSAEICLDAGAGAATAKTCTTVVRLGAKPGESQATIPVPSALATGPARLLVSRVILYNASGRTAGPSAPVFVAGGAAPQPITNLHATAVPEGAMIEWQPLASDATTPGASVELLRTDLTSPDTKRAKPAAPPTPTSTKPAKPHKKTKSAAATKAQPAPSPADQPANTIHLSVPSGDPSRGGGTIDRSVSTGDTYVYSAHRVLKVAIDGHQLRLVGDSSGAATLVVRDTFPPAVPTGLDAVANPVSDVNKVASIDLSWAPDIDVDLAGYLVYRQSSPGGEFVRLTPTPIIAAAFSDATATPRQRYTYRVTAVDTSGNESKPSAESHEQINP